jgi:hypothetical protein
VCTIVRMRVREMQLKGMAWSCSCELGRAWRVQGSQRKEGGGVDVHGSCVRIVAHNSRWPLGGASARLESGLIECRGGIFATTRQECDNGRLSTSCGCNAVRWGERACSGMARGRGISVLPCAPPCRRRALHNLLHTEQDDIDRGNHLAHRRVGEEHIWHGSSVGELEYLHDAMGAALATTSTTAHASKAHLGHVSLGSDGDVCPNFSGGGCNQSRTFLRGRSARPPSQPLRRPAAAHGSSS